MRGRMSFTPEQIAEIVDIGIPSGFYVRDGKMMISWVTAWTMMILNDVPIAIGGQLCDANGCLAYADRRTFWPEPGHAFQVKCGPHAEHLEQIAIAMGFTLHVEPWWQITADDPDLPRCPLM